MDPRKIRVGLAAITETGCRAVEGRLPEVSKITSPGQWRKPAATSMGVMPASRLGRLEIPVVTCDIAMEGKGRKSCKARRKNPGDQKICAAKNARCVFQSRFGIAAFSPPDHVS